MSMSLTCNLRDRGEKGEGARLCECVCECVCTRRARVCIKGNGFIHFGTHRSSQRKTVCFIYLTCVICAC